MKKWVLLISLFLFAVFPLHAQYAACATSATLKVSVQMCNTLSNIAGLNHLNIAPNPSQGQFDLTFEMDEKNTLAIHLSDPLGQVVYKEQGQYKGLVRRQIQLENLSSGVYFLILKNEQGIVSKKVVVK